jgi:hypothetical protein
MSPAEKKCAVEVELFVPQEQAEAAIEQLRTTLSELGYPLTLITKEAVQNSKSEPGGNVQIHRLQ